jgi:hypothetical protein
MRLELSLALYGDHLSLVMRETASRGGWAATLRAMVARDISQNRAAHTTGGSGGVSTQYALEFIPETLSTALEQAWATAVAKHRQASKKADLSVQLGLAHARLGLVPLVQDGGTHLTKEAIDSYTQAWVGQMWSLDPATQIIRWEASEAGEQVLISCIDRGVYEELESFAHRHSLRFLSCTPAVLHEVHLAAPEPRGKSSAEQQSAQGVITVWTEPSSTGQRTPLVQLIHHLDSQPQALWRGWLPKQESSDAPDDALQGALRRFMAANKVPSNTAVKWVHLRHQLPSGPGPGAQT